MSLNTFCSAYHNHFLNNSIFIKFFWRQCQSDQSAADWERLKGEYRQLSMDHPPDIREDETWVLTHVNLTQMIMIGNMQLPFFRSGNKVNVRSRKKVRTQT